MSKFRLAALTAAFGLLACASAAQAATVTLSFDELDGDPGQFEDPLTFYAGGAGSRGTSGGADLGVSFVGGWGALCAHSATCLGSSIVGNPSGLNSVVAGAQTIFIDVAGGFSDGIAFSWFSSVNGRIEIWSGLGGTGQMLNAIDLLARPDGRNTPGCGPDGFACPFLPASLQSMGVGHSLKFTGFSGSAAFDDISFLGVTLPSDGVPEPSAWALMILGFGLAGAVLRRKSPLTV